MRDPQTVVILDSDLLILGDISPLWTRNKVLVTPDIGNRPYAVVSERTGKPVINSGVISLPRKARGPTAWKAALDVLAKVDRDDELDIERYADQRFWNILLRQLDFELLPQNFNAIKTLIEKEYAHEIGRVSVLHLTGPKPWYEFLHRSLLEQSDIEQHREGKVRFRATFALWNNTYRRSLLRRRLGQFREEMDTTLEQLEGIAAKRPALMIGNGPSISKTDLKSFCGFEKFCFNWFVNYQEFDEVKPDHLVVASHMLFGGWGTPRPKIPPEYLKALLMKKHKPRLWFAYYFKEYVEKVPELDGYQKAYFFFEKPFKQPVANRGLTELNIRNPLVDCNTGVLTAGVPLAVHLGVRQIVLVGCDSNYSSAAGSYVTVQQSPTSRGCS